MAKFWTDKRLDELLALSRSMNIYELSKHFGKNGERINQALDFAKKRAALLIFTETVEGVKVTRYGAGYAEGATWGAGAPILAPCEQKSGVGCDV